MRREVGGSSRAWRSAFERQRHTQYDEGDSRENESQRGPILRPLLNIRLVIEGREGAAFAYTLPTLDTGASREIPFADFRTQDGTLFEVGSTPAKQIKTTARDTLGNNYDVTTPWEPAPGQR